MHFFYSDSRLRILLVAFFVWHTRVQGIAYGRRRTIIYLITFCLSQSSSFQIYTSNLIRYSSTHSC